MTGKARVECTEAAEFDRNDVQVEMKVHAARLPTTIIPPFIAASVNQENPIIKVIFAALNIEIMPGTELFGAEEKKEINDVLETGIMFRFNHDAQRNNIWKAKDFEAEVRKITGARFADKGRRGVDDIA